MFFNGGTKCLEVLCIAKHAALDSLKDLRELRVDLEVAINVSVAELLDILSKISEKENVLLADFAGDFDLNRS